MNFGDASKGRGWTSRGKASRGFSRFNPKRVTLSCCIGNDTPANHSQTQLLLFSELPHSTITPYYFIPSAPVKEASNKRKARIQGREILPPMIENGGYLYPLIPSSLILERTTTQDQTREGWNSGSRMSTASLWRGMEKKGFPFFFLSLFFFILSCGSVVPWMIVPVSTSRDKEQDYIVPVRLVCSIHSLDNLTVPFF